MSRNHAVRRSAPGLVSVAGGNYTTYRLMARDVVDVAAHDLPFAVDASRTADVPLLGAVGLSGAEFRLSRHPGATAVSSDQVHHLLARHGNLAAEVLDLVTAEPELATALVGAENYVSAEVVFAATHEGALHVDDVLTRRTHVAFEVPDRGLLAAESVARLMAPVLAWNEAPIDREITHYRARLEAELAAQAMLDDAGSNVARSGARDPRLGSSAVAAE